MGSIEMILHNKKNLPRLAMIISFMMVLSFGFQNCSKKKSVTQAPSEQELRQQKVVALFSEKCASCHTGEAAFSNAAGTNDPITNITDVDYLVRSRLIIGGEPDISPIFQKIQGADMPPGQPLNLTDVNLIKEWITLLNFQEIDTGTIGETLPLAATYNSLRANVFLKKCYTCHVNRAVKLDTYASVSGAIATQNLRNRVNGIGNIMPPVNAQQLTPQEKTTLLQWIDAGAANN
jgi:uncharacterized membrane protein